ncbi:MAG: hypothetical protein GEU26_06560 [Nitrososphaeraceae archaeon]|nr:hypothetical protein [Nitrososphaeraceae archaeon]
MTYIEHLVTENYKIQDTVCQVNCLLIEIREFLSGLTLEKLDHKDVKDVKETDEYRLKIVKGLSNRELDIHIFEVLRTYAFLSDHLDKLYFEKDKRVKYGLMPIDGGDWEAASNGRPSIGPRIDMKVEETGYE